VIRHLPKCSAVRVRPNEHADDECLDSEDDGVASLRDDANGYEVRPRERTHHGRADDVRRERAGGHVRYLHASARAHVARLDEARPRFPSGRRQSGTAASDYRAESQPR
jgi:hypothetical protein